MADNGTTRPVHFLLVHGELDVALAKTQARQNTVAVVTMRLLALRMLRPIFLVVPQKSSIVVSHGLVPREPTMRLRLLRGGL